MHPAQIDLLNKETIILRSIVRWHHQSESIYS